MSIWESGRYRHDYGKIMLATPEAINLETAGQYYKIPGTFEIYNSGRFNCSSAGVLTYIGISGVFLMNGISELEVSKAAIITYATKKNNTVVSDTDHEFTAAAKTETISTTNIFTLEYGDTLEVFAKSNVDNNLMTPSTLKVTFFGARQ